MQVDFEDAEETTLKKMAPQNGCCLVAQTVLPDLLPNCVQAYICRYRFWCSILLVLCAVTDVYLAVLDLSIRTSTPPSLLFMATVCGVGSSDVRKRLFVCKGGGDSRGMWIWRAALPLCDQYRSRVPPRLHLVPVDIYFPLFTCATITWVGSTSS